MKSSTFLVFWPSLYRETSFLVTQNGNFLKRPPEWDFSESRHPSSRVNKLAGVFSKNADGMPRFAHYILIATRGPDGNNNNGGLLCCVCAAESPFIQAPSEKYVAVISSLEDTLHTPENQSTSTSAEGYQM